MRASSPGAETLSPPTRWRPRPVPRGPTDAAVRGYTPSAANGGPRTRAPPVRGVGQDGDVPHVRRIAVAATGQQALDAGLAVAADGGNAVDAALATAFVALATEPGMVSFGGGAYVSVWPAGGDPVVVDGNVEMPGRGADPDRFGRGVREVRTDYGGGVTMMAGHGSVATPGIIPAFAVAAERYASLPWARLVEPAATAARAYPMGRAASRYLAFVADTLFAEDDEARALVTGDGGAVLAGGEERANHALADTLDRLAVEGPSLFSTGDVGRALAASMAEHDGLVTAEDLAAYEPVVRPAHLTRAGGWTVAVNPPPAVGGPMLAVMLGELAPSRRTGPGTTSSRSSARCCPTARPSTTSRTTSRPTAPTCSPASASTA